MIPYRTLAILPALSALILCHGSVLAEGLTPPSTGDAYRACVSEALWPVRSQAPYLNGSARTREVLDNRFEPSATRFSSFCRLMSEAPSVDVRLKLNADCQAEVSAEDRSARTAIRLHLQRMAALCQSFAKIAS